MENWNAVVGFEGVYEVSDCGNVRRIARGKGAVLGKNRKLVNRGGYRQVILSAGNKVTLHWVHRLVAFAFLGPPPSPVAHVNHLDGDRANNHLSNLEWTSASGNLAHAYRIGRRSVSETQRSRVFNEEDIRAIRKLSEDGARTAVIAGMYGVTRASIGAIISRRTWAHVV